MSEPPDSLPFTKDHPFLAQIAESRLLNRPGSAKETRHFVIDLAGSGLHYEAGDSLGVFPTNRPSEIAEILRWLDVTGDEPVTLPRTAAPISLREALTSRLALSVPTRKFVETLSTVVDDPSEKERLAALLAPEAAAVLTEFLAEREFVDLLAEFPSAQLSPQALVDNMRRLMPRLYSIASSPREHSNAAHLTVAVVRYRTNNRDRFGVCSTFLAERARVGETPVPVFVSHSHFRPPENPAADAIMVGPGTGIAPFRAFVQDRAAASGTGRNWIFFGEQHRATDYLYEEEWARYLERGQLHRFDTAFSRDQGRKVYVQDRLREHSAEVWEWLQRGGYFYVCGDAKRMAKDVDTALHDIVAAGAGLTPQAAADYVKQLKKEKRYQRDVY